MSNKACCVKIKNCSGKLKGMAESQAFLVEKAPKEIGEKLENRIKTFWDETLEEAANIEKQLFEVK